MKPLSKSPNEIVEISDDTDAKALLVQLGVINKFPESPNLSEPWAARVGYADHPTHWIMATLFTGFPNAIDNGYVIYCLPKSQFALPDANQWLRANNQSLFPDGPEVEGHQPIHPPQN